MSSKGRSPNEVESNNLSGIVEAAMEIAEWEAQLFEQLKAALLSGDDKRALQLARELCGIEDESRVKGKGKK